MLFCHGQETSQCPCNEEDIYPIEHSSKKDVQDLSIMLFFWQTVLGSQITSWKSSTVQTPNSPHSTPPSISVLIYFSESPLTCLLQVLFRGMPLPTHSTGGKTSRWEIVVNFILFFCNLLLLSWSQEDQGHFKMVCSMLTRLPYLRGSRRTVDRSILLVTAAVCDGRRLLGQASLGCHAFVGKCHKLPHGTHY